MGYCMRQTDSNFKIKVKNHPEALRALKEFAQTQSRISWINNIQREILDVKTLEEALYNLGWSADVNIPKVLSKAQVVNHLKAIQKTGNIEKISDLITKIEGEKEDFYITDILFEGEKIGNESSFFKAIAPFVKEGSFIEMVGEDGEKWRWVFENGQCVEKQAKFE